MCFPYIILFIVIEFLFEANFLTSSKQRLSLSHIPGQSFCSYGNILFLGLKFGKENVAGFCSQEHVTFFSLESLLY